MTLRQRMQATFPVIIVVMMILSSSVVLTDKLFSRYLFYFATVYTLLFLAMGGRYKKPSPAECLLALGALAVGLSQYLWWHRFPGGPHSHFMADVNYRTTSRILLAGVVLLYCISPLVKTCDKRAGKPLCALIIIGFLYISANGVYDHLIAPDLRLRIDTAATTTAYLYMLQTFITLQAVRVANFRYHKTLLAAVIVMSFVILLLTETRTVLFLYPVLLLIFHCNKRIVFTAKTLATLVVVMALAVMVIDNYFQDSVERVKSTFWEISQLRDNKDTSLGSRVILWESGWDVFTSRLWGQSTQHRYDRVKHQIITQENGSPEALRNSVFHLHNDVIEAASLQGVTGLAALVFFYLSIAVYIIKKGMFRPAFLFLFVPVILIGLVDCLFINDRFVVLLLSQLLIYRYLSGVGTTEGNHLPAAHP
ncbi:O-antigen ligase family protein [Martelella alba]|uniref:O-antigen ligase family protein n=1 Tax=Martelella alba TaxID=2590451 RepID=A0ABY2SHC7_9HYPH|nr:O-antigen ligase family protein [Martelella alba]TKI04673.1 O-antigen ligase family protein [Martelella alba]